MSSHGSEYQELLERRARVMSASYRMFYQEHVHAVSGKGVWLKGADGREYLDFYNNVPVVGHCHPHVVEQIHKQASKLNTHTRYLNEQPIELAERILATMPDALGSVIFTCTGSEANDLAIRTARLVSGGRGVIVSRRAYHGTSTLLAGMSPVTGLPTDDDVFTIDIPMTIEDPTQFGALVRGAIEEMGRQGIKPAALLVDTIFGSDGVVSDPAGFLLSALEEIHRAGGLFIADEVQPGFGRTGAGMWGFARHGIVPDFVTMGKPMGNGHPVAALVTTREIDAVFAQHQRYFNTFGGNTVACAAAQAVLDVIAREDLIAHTAKMGAVLERGLRDLAARHETIGQIRGVGLFFGAQLPSGEIAAKVLNGLRDRDVLIGVAGEGNASLKIRPPLVVGEAEIGVLIDRLDDTLKAVA